MAIHTYTYTHICTYRERNREWEGGERLTQVQIQCSLDKPHTLPESVLLFSQLGTNAIGAREGGSHKLHQ